MEADRNIRKVWQGKRLDKSIMKLHDRHIRLTTVARRSGRTAAEQRHISAYAFKIKIYCIQFDLDKLLKHSIESHNFRPLAGSLMQVAKDVDSIAARNTSSPLDCWSVWISDAWAGQTFWLKELRMGNERIRRSAAEWYNSDVRWRYIKKTLCSPLKKDGKSILVVASSCRAS